MPISTPATTAPALRTEHRLKAVGNDGGQLITEHQPDRTAIYVRQEMEPRISVVIPAMNEQHNIGWVLRRLPMSLHEVIVVDGQSVDDTVAEAVRVRPDVRVIAQESKGKGAALAVGLAAVTGDIVVIIDADGSMDPVEIAGLVGALLSGADVAKGSRASAGGGSRDLSALRKLGNRGLTLVANRLYRQSWRELCYGYAAFWTDVLPLLSAAALASGEIDARSTGNRTEISYGHGFEIEALLFCRAAKAHLRVAEVFSFEHERRYGESNLVTFRDGWRVLTAVWRERRFQAPLRSSVTHLRRYPLLPHLHNTEQTLQGVTG